MVTKNSEQEILILSYMNISWGTPRGPVCANIKI
jgi:hypothetical protein